MCIYTYTYIYIYIYTHIHTYIIVDLPSDFPDAEWCAGRSTKERGRNRLCGIVPDIVETRERSVRAKRQKTAST